MAISRLFLFTILVLSENLMRGINELTDLVKIMKKEMTYQNAEIKHIQTLIESCSACQTAGIEIDHNTCQFSSPCFQGER